eukprot:28369-Eustigmatos_ZCMA.PRE.1
MRCGGGQSGDDAASTRHGVEGTWVVTAVDVSPCGLMKRCGRQRGQSGAGDGSGGGRLRRRFMNMLPDTPMTAGQD